MDRTIARIASRAAIADIDLWWEDVSPQVESAVSDGHRLAAIITTRYLRRHAALEGRTVEPERIELDREQMRTALRVTGPVAYKTNIEATGDEFAARAAMSTRLRGTAVRLTFAGSRDTTTATVQASDQIAGWRRFSQGTPCPFCAMIISRGAVYKERIGLRQPQFHDHDRCLYEPLYEVEPEPRDVVDLRRQWQETTDGLSGVDALNAFRRART